MRASGGSGPPGGGGPTGGGIVPQRSGPEQDITRGSPVAIALDLGGTNLKGGLVGPGGTRAHMQARETRAELGYEGVLAELCRFVEDLRLEIHRRELTLVGIGIGAPGPLNREAGVIEFAPNLGWRRAPLGRDLERLTGVHLVRLENDANAATFAEAWVGDASAARCLLGVTLGTGVGSGLVIGGRLFGGAGGIAGEIGHVVVQPDGRRCRCGNRGCVEAYFSAWALAARGAELARQRPGHPFSADPRPEDVLEAWQGGDPLVAPAVESGLRALALALAGSVNLLNPDRVVFFGGLAGSWDVFGPSLLAHVERYALPAAFATAQFSASSLAWAGVLGAGGLVLFQAAEL